MADNNFRYIVFSKILCSIISINRNDLSSVIVNVFRLISSFGIYLAYTIKRVCRRCFVWGSGSKRVKVKVKWSRYRPSVAQTVGRGIALLFHDRGTRRGWVVSSTPRPHFTTAKDPVPILQEAGWAPWPVWAGGKSRPHRDSIPDRPAPSQSLYRLSYPAQEVVGVLLNKW